MSCATEIHKPITYRAAWAPFHPFSVLFAFQIYWMSLCSVEKRANWSLSSTFFPIQRHIILPAAGGKEVDVQASKPLPLSHFLLLPKI